MPALKFPLNSKWTQLLITVPLLGLCLLATSPVDAQTMAVKDWNNMSDTLMGAIGLHYGNLGGNGLSFRYPLRWFLYVQAAGGIWHTTDDQKHNLGLQVNYILRQDSTLRLYLSAGAGYFYHREVIGQSAGVDQWHKSRNWNKGAGVGVEYLLAPRVAFLGELDFVHEGEDGEVKVSPQAGIHFYW